MSASAECCMSTEAHKKELKVVPNPKAFFEILRESDENTRSTLLNSVELCFDDEDTEREMSLNLRPSTLSLLDNGWKSNLPAILHQLAGNIYIEKDRLKRKGALGEGGFAVVEKMELETEGKKSETVAVKKLKPGVIEDDEDLKELVEESNLLRHVKHRGIVEFKGIGCFDERSVESMRCSIFLAEEFMSGGTLKRVILEQMRAKTDRQYRVCDAWRWLLQVAEALAYLHTCTPSVVHRDLKPDNVLMSSPILSEASAKIADFGLHKRINKVTKLQKAKSSKVLELRHPSDTSSIQEPGQNSISYTERPTRNSFFLEIPSHFRILKKSSSLTLETVSRDSLLQMVPEESEVNDACLPLPSAFSVPELYVQEDPSPIHLVCPPSSEKPSLATVMGELHSEAEISENNSSDICTSLETQVSKSEKRVRGGQLASLFNLHAQQEAIASSSQHIPSVSLRSQTQPHNLHFLFEPESEPERDTRSHNSLEKVQRGGSRALDKLKQSPTDFNPQPLNTKIQTSPFQTSSTKYFFSLAGTNDVSGIVGSLMYMAPEVTKGRHYDEKVDVFSFGVVMYELLKSELTMVGVMAQAGKPSEMHHQLKKYAKAVSKGHRELIPAEWPSAVQELIQNCWSQQPRDRPKMSEVVERLKSVEKNGFIERMDQTLENTSAKAPICCSWCALT